MPLESETQTYEQHREELLGTAQGKFALIHGTEVAGVYDSKSDAIREGYRRFGNVPFLVKQILAVDVPQNFVSQLLGVLCLSGCFSIPPDVGVSRHDQSLKVLGTPDASGGCGRPPGAQAEERLEAGHGGPPPILPKDELIEVDLELAAADTVVGTDQPLLQVADGAVGKRDDGFGALSQPELRRLRPRDVLVAGRGESVEALEAICVDGGTDRDVSRDEPPYRSPGEVGNDLHSDSARCTSTSLDGDQDQGCLASLELAAAPKPCLGSAHPRLVKFNLAPKRLPSRVHHRSTKLVENHPCGFVAADPELALQEQGRETTLVCRHQVGGPEPRRERRLRVVKDCPRRQRDLVTARGTLPPTAAGQGVGATVTAPGAGETVRPAARSEVLRTPFFGGKLRLKVLKARGKGRSGHASPYP